MTANANSLLQEPVARLLNQHPETVAVFIRHRMACPGCSIAAFETVAEALAIYRLDREGFADELTRVIRYGAVDPATTPREED